MHTEQHDFVAYLQALSDDELLRRYKQCMFSEENSVWAAKEIAVRGLPLPSDDGQKDADSEANAGDYCILTRYLDPLEAELLQMHLRACAIPAFAADINNVRIHPAAGFVGGGASVRVREKYMPEALIWLSAYAHNTIVCQAPTDSEQDSADLSDEALPSKGLKTFRVYRHPQGKNPPIAVKEGFSWGAFIFNPWWFVIHGMWGAFMLACTLIVTNFSRMYLPASPYARLFDVGMFVFIFLCGVFAHALLCLELENRAYVLQTKVRAKRASDALTLAAAMLERECE